MRPESTAKQINQPQLKTSPIDCCRLDPDAICSDRRIRLTISAGQDLPDEHDTEIDIAGADLDIAGFGQELRDNTSESDCISELVLDVHGNTDEISLYNGKYIFNRGYQRHR